MNFTAMIRTTLISIAATTAGGVLTVVGLSRSIRAMTIGGVILAGVGIIFFITGFIRAWRALHREKKRKEAPSYESVPQQRPAGSKAGQK